ncbi:MAG TPA: flagellar hook-associated protein FlgK [Paraburkholderia sp.]|jgi:flagellar hook-associated protein 1 FlgK
MTLFSTGLSGLNAAQLGMATTGNNISNAATAGYNREIAILAEANGQNSGAGFIGGGVNTTTIQRQFSAALTAELNNAQAQNSSLASYSGLISSLNNLVGSPTGGISSSISAFFNGLQGIVNSANSSPARGTAISNAQTLAAQINAAGTEFDQLRQSVNTSLSSDVTQVNSLTKQIAQLNSQIAAAGAGGQPPNQLLDARDLAVSNLTQLVGVSVVQDNQGNMLVSLSSGQPLVSGAQSYNLAAVTSPDDPSEMVIAYQQPSATNPGQMVSSILSDSAVTGGDIGGQLAFRSQTLDPAEAQLGAIATSFASQVNAQNALGIDQNGNTGGDLFKVAPPNVIANANNTGTETLSATLANPASPPVGDFKLSFDGTTYTLTNTTTGKVVGTSTTQPTAANPIGGIALTLSGPMTAGDSFTIQPTRGAVNSFGLVAGVDGSQIAAASPAIASNGTANSGTGKIQINAANPGFVINSSMNLTYDATTNTLSGFPPGTTVTVNTTPPQTITIGAATDPVPYDPTNGTTFTINSTATPPVSPNGISFTLTGKPATGDTFTVGPNTGGTADGSNASAMSNLVSSTALGGATLTDSYAGYVNNIGNTASQVTAAATSQGTLVSQITAQQQSVSGVNLDEEATNLLQFQQLYQANSKVIQTAQSLFDTILQALN